MELTAIYKGHSEVTEGVSQGGNAWRKCAFIFETTGDFSKTVAFNVMNSTIENFLQLQPGRIYTVLFDLSSREYNGKWYTDAKAWGVKDMAAADTPAPSLMQPQPKAKAVQTSLKMTPQPFTDTNLNTNDDLPF